ncbi:hypothetical protein Scep_004164 [Stephania cephalantha]|uniref:Uncharacterized protein n=1 Tax=Stephania cephalantha TaxID=152367 RepID=A0AAP0KUG6_9MAGN
MAARPSREPPKARSQHPSTPFPGGPKNQTLLKSFNNHVAAAIWNDESRTPSNPMRSTSISDGVQGANFDPGSDDSSCFVCLDFISLAHT